MRAVLLALALFALAAPPVATAKPSRTGLIDAAAGSSMQFEAGDRRLFHFGYSGGRFGDVDGDGVDDLVFATALRSNPSNYVTLVASGRRFERGARVEVSALRHFLVSGFGGLTAINAGDVNGDGLGDMLAQSTYDTRYDVVFGRPTWQDVDVLSLGEHGFSLEAPMGVEVIEGSGSPVGDVNGDGFADLAVALARENRGRGYVAVVFGSSSSETVRLDALGDRGYLIDHLCNGIDEYVYPAGFYPGGLRDLNGDGLDEVAVTVATADDPVCRAGRRGQALIVFGQRSTAPVDARALGRRGQRFARRRGPLGSVGGVGDTNGDGLTDLIFNDERQGLRMVFGRSKPGSIAIERAPGYLIHHAAHGPRYGGGPIGDFNGDGLGDFAISGHVIFGSRSTEPVILDRLGRRGFRVLVTSALPTSTNIAAGGDLLGDRRSELMVGGSLTDTRPAVRVLEAEALPYVGIAPLTSLLRIEPRTGLFWTKALCPATTRRLCRGVVTLTLAAPGRRLLLHRRFRARAGRVARIGGRLSDRVLRAIRSADRPRVIVEAVARDASGRRARTERVLRPHLR